MKAIETMNRIQMPDVNFRGFQYPFETGSFPYWYYHDPMNELNAFSHFSKENQIRSIN